MELFDFVGVGKISMQGTGYLLSIVELVAGVFF
jgi:hypothetical protein